LIGYEICKVSRMIRKLLLSVRPQKDAAGSSSSYNHRNIALPSASLPHEQSSSGGSSASTLAFPMSGFTSSKYQNTEPCETPSTSINLQHPISGNLNPHQGVPLGVLARTAIAISNFSLDSPTSAGPSKVGDQHQKHSSNDVPSSSLCPANTSNSNDRSFSYPKKKDLFNRSETGAMLNPTMIGNSSSTSASLTPQPFSVLSSDSSSNRLQSSTIHSHLIHSDKIPSSWVLSNPSYGNIGPIRMNLGPSSGVANNLILPGATLIRISNPNTANNIANSVSAAGRNFYSSGSNYLGHDAELNINGAIRGVYDNQRLRQIKSKKKVFRALIQINGDVSQPIVSSSKIMSCSNKCIFLLGL
jgi:hypothetical protein